MDSSQSGRDPRAPYTSPPRPNGGGPHTMEFASVDCSAHSRKMVRRIALRNGFKRFDTLSMGPGFYLWRFNKPS